MPDGLKQWFAREILVHERALLRFMDRVWPDPSEVDDLCQETYIRVYEAAAKTLPTSPRGFLFATARHLMADRIRRRQDCFHRNAGRYRVPERLDRRGISGARLNGRQELWRLAQAFGSLPAKCRDVMWLMKVEELTRREIAERLKITPKAVEKRIERGVRLLEEAWFGGRCQDESSTQTADTHSGETSKDEPGHG